MPDIDCDCHLYCSQGDKPSDCNVIPAIVQAENVMALSWGKLGTGKLGNAVTQYGYPYGMHGGDAEHEGDRQRHTYYCSTHDEYYDKVAILIDVDWSQKDKRASPDMRDFGKGTY
jgi:hypothetical protein